MLVPFLLLFGGSSSTTAPQSYGVSPPYTTDGQVIFGSFIGIAVILALLLIPLLYVMRGGKQPLT